MSKFKLKKIDKVVWSAFEGRHFTFGGEIDIEIAGEVKHLTPLDDQRIMRELHALGHPYILQVGKEQSKKNKPTTREE